MKFGEVKIGEIFSTTDDIYYIKTSYEHAVRLIDLPFQEKPLTSTELESNEPSQESYERQIMNLRHQLAEAGAERDYLASSALGAASVAGVCTPEEGYVKYPQCLSSDISRLAKERDESLRVAREAIDLLIAVGKYCVGGCSSCRYISGGGCTARIYGEAFLASPAVRKVKGIKQ